jgi:hypothetical protein
MNVRPRTEDRGPRTSPLRCAGLLLIGAARAAAADSGEIDFDNDPRPIVLPPDVVEAHAAVPFVAVPGGDTITFASVGFAYGPASPLEVGGDLLVKVQNGAQKFSTTEHVAFDVWHRGKLEIAVAPAVGLAVVDVGDQGLTDVAFLLGAWVRYHRSQKLSFFTGQPALPIAGTTAGLPPQTYQLTIGLNHDQGWSLALPAGVAYQPTRSLYAFAALELASVGTRSDFLFADFIPVGFGALVSPHDGLDLGVEVNDDLEDATGRFVLQVFARLYVR